MPFDPFGDFAGRGYLRNFAGEQDSERVRRLEHRSFSANVLAALEALQQVQRVSYQDVLDVHRTLFGSVYPWAGQDRLALAPDIAVGKAGHFDLFAHPRDIKRAVEYGLDLAHNSVAMRDRPGEVFGLLAYGHPVLEGNGRMLMTVHADLSRRAGFHVAWQHISKAAFYQPSPRSCATPAVRWTAFLRRTLLPARCPWLPRLPASARVQTSMRQVN